MISAVVGVKIKQIMKNVNPFVDEKQLCNADIKSIIVSDSDADADTWRMITFNEILRMKAFLKFVANKICFIWSRRGLVCSVSAY